MNQRLIAATIFTACFGWLTAASAHGQYGRRAPINRPSAGPSTRIGRLGGVYTGQYGVSDLDPGSTRGLSQPNYLGAAAGLGRVPMGPLPQALMFAQVGYSPGRASSGMFGLMGGATSRQLASISGLRASQRFTVPLTGIRPQGLRFPDRPYYAPEPEGNALQVFFGLKPTRPPDMSETAVPVDGWVGLLERENARFLDELRTRAFQTFKRAMTEDVENRAELLSAAQRALTTVRDLEPQAYIPCLLLIHTALEKGQILQAIGDLSNLVSRHPSVFIDRPEIASYYGDAERLANQQQWRSELLERQMRKYLRIGDENPGTPSAYLLQAYCAWVLNDPTRIRHALDQMSAAEQEAGVDPKIVAVRYALAAAIK